MKKRLQPLALHEAGHAIALSAYGGLLESPDDGYAIEMDYETGNGEVNYEEKSYERLSVEQKTVVALAGLAAERYFRKDCGVVYWTEKVGKNRVIHIPRQPLCLSNEDETGDLDTVDDLMPKGVGGNHAREEQWCNHHLKTAWDLLHEHEAAFLKLATRISFGQRSKFGGDLSVLHVFEPSAVEHILVKVRPVSKPRRKAA
jgi:hypothetical protein